jgi:hypothetical protein
MAHPNQTTWQDVVDLIPEIWEQALYYAMHRFVMPRNVTVFSDMRGMTPRNVSEYQESGGVQRVAETDDILAVPFEREFLAKLEPAEIGLLHDLTDQRLETDPENTIVDATTNLGYNLGRTMEEDLLTNFRYFTGGSIGTVDGDFSLDLIFRARAMLEVEAIPGPYIAVIHPFHWSTIYKEVLDFQNPGLENFKDARLREYYAPGLADVRIVPSTLLPRTPVYTLTIDATGGTFTLSVDGEETANINHNANAGTIQTALEALDNVVAGDVTVADHAGDPDFSITFQQNFLNSNVELVADGALLTGGGSTAVVGVESNYTAAGLYTQDAIALDMRRGFRLELDRDASHRATELVATMIYAHSPWRASRGVQILADTTEA